MYLQNNVIILLPLGCSSLCRGSNRWWDGLDVSPECGTSWVPALI